MKAVIQRVVDASVAVDGIVKGCIKSGLLVYLGVANDDSETDADWLSEKTANLRIFDDADGKMNLSLKDIAANTSAGVLAVSQFTLLGDARKGRRPSWNGAAPPEKAKQLYEYFMAKIREQGLVCESGEFQAHMKVTYTNDGPVTILLDSELISL
ncbi:MAG: D-tyrosyl-tRNA(Tyr) deacylase [Treponema sp.]|jgi:D-tyrosyl-tRNA(Tyr) deacylase|nr:D-tyrosyl-tRNA(Tyr) deacylase [Treponema sp.]